MTNIEILEQALPVAPLKIIALESCKELGEKVDRYIVNFRQESLNNLDSSIYSSYQTESYLAKSCCPRFGSGEAKGWLSPLDACWDCFQRGGPCCFWPLSFCFSRWW